MKTQLSSFFPQQHIGGSSRSTWTSEVSVWFRHKTSCSASVLISMLEGRWKGGQWRRVTAIEKESEGENRRKKCDLHPGRNYFKRRSICSAVGEHKPFLFLLELFHSEWETYFTSFCKKFGDISDTSPHWPCNAMTGNRRRSMPPRERERESERGSGGRNSWLEWRKCQHFDTNSWGASKMTNGPTGWALNLTSLSFLTAHLLILDS